MYYASFAAEQMFNEHMALFAWWCLNVITCDSYGRSSW